MRKVLYFLLGLVVLMQFRLWVSEDGYRAAWRLGEQIEIQQQENEQLRERNRALAAEVSDLRTGLDAVEEIVRSELGMIRSGETLYQVMDSEDDDRASAAEAR